MEQEARNALKTLDAKRKALEMEADAIESELTCESPEGEPPMGIDTPLTDADGYPRGDIDVYRARTLRQRLAVIRSDHKAIMKDIERDLAILAAMKKPAAAEAEKAEMEARKAEKPKPKFDPVSRKWVAMNWDGSVAGVENGEQRSFSELETPPVPPAASNVREESKPTVLEPFAIINAVAANSPAQEAGLKEEDLVVEFGRINHTNHRNLMALADVVPEAAGNHEGIQIMVLRKAADSDGGSFSNLTLYPRPWEGRGMLGCHILPYEA